jgi:acyltransferase-like protein
MATTVARTAKVRLPAVDNLRAAMIAWIIGGHALLGYSAIGGWPYSEVQEVTFDRRTELALAAVLGPTALFVIGSFFFVAGLFAPGAVARKGPPRYAVDRVLRLGVPFLVFMLLIWPSFMWLAYRAAGHRISLWHAFTHRTPFLDSGPLWFAEVLLYVSLGYAAWVWLAPRLGRGRAESPSPLTGRTLVAVAAAVAIASFVVRLEFPARSKQILDLHLWQWPQCVGMFLLGVVASRHAWAARVPDHIRRHCGFAVAGTLLAVPVVAAVVGVHDLAGDAAPFLGGWHWQAAALAGIEAALVVFGTVWILGVAQDHLRGDSRLWRHATRGAFAAFLLQAPVLITLSVVARPVTVPAEVKALVVGGIAVPLCFWLGWLLVDRTRVGRLL